MELEHDPVRREGLFFDQPTFRRDLYRLACAFFASADFARLGRAADDEPVSALAAEHQEDEISRLLVTIAATVRVIQDRDATASRSLQISCGRLLPNLANAKEVEPLSLREACNKIIHATKFNFDIKPLPHSERQLPNPTHVLRPLLHLYGKQRNAHWKAELNVIHFVRANAALVRG